MNKNDGPIFPVTFEAPDGRQCTITGITLRDWFAGQIMPALIVSKSRYTIDELAYQAYLHADAMLEKRG